MVCATYSTVYLLFAGNVIQTGPYHAFAVTLHAYQKSMEVQTVFFSDSSKLGSVEGVCQPLDSVAICMYPDCQIAVWSK